MKRLQIRDPNTGIVPLRPQARAVDTFVLPNVQQKLPNQTLGDLSNALTTLNPLLEKFADRQREEMTASDVAQAKVDFDKNRMDYKEAVEKGLVPAGASPHYQRQYRLSSLRLKATDFKTYLIKAWATSDIRDNDDPAAYDAWVAAKTKEFMDANMEGHFNEEITEAFFPAAQAAQENLRSRHTANRIRAVEEGNEANLGQEAAGAGEDAINTGATSQETAVILAGIILEYTQNGMSHRVANRKVVDAIALIAVEKGDVDILSALGQIKTGKGVLGKTNYAVNKMRLARNTIIAAEDRKDRLSVAAEALRKAEAYEKATGSFAQAWSDAKGDLDPNEWLRANGMFGNSKIVSAVHTLSAKLEKSTDTEVDDNTYIMFYEMIRKNPKNPDIGDMLNHAVGSTLDRTTHGKIWDDWQRAKSVSTSSKMRDPMFKRGMTLISTAIMGDVLSSSFVDERAPDVMIAQSDYYMRAVAYLQENQKATDTEFRAFTLGVFTEITDRYRKIYAAGAKTPTASTAPTAPNSTVKVPTSRQIEMLRIDPSRRAGFDRAFPENPSANYLPPPK